MPPRTRPIVILALALILFSVFTADWFIERVPFWTRGWGLWGGHTCSTTDMGCAYFSFDDQLMGGAWKRWSFITLAVTALPVAGLLLLAIVRRPSAWMRYGTMAGAAASIVAAVWTIRNRPTPLDEESIWSMGANFPLYLVGMVIVFALATLTVPAPPPEASDVPQL